MVYCLLVLIFISLQQTLGLHCGIRAVKEENEALQTVATICIKNYKSTFVLDKSENNATATNSTKFINVKSVDLEKLEDEYFFNPRRGLYRHKRATENQTANVNSTTSNGTVLISKEASNGTVPSVGSGNGNSTINLGNGTILNSGTNGTNLANETISSTNITKSDKDDKAKPIVLDECTVKCFLQNLALLNVKGYPKHSKMSKWMVSLFEGKELVDFVQDTVDECFFFMDKLEGDRLDSCGYSAKLVACFAEKARNNCEDWPIGNLPFSVPQ